MLSEDGPQQLALDNVFSLSFVCQEFLVLLINYRDLCGLFLSVVVLEVYIVQLSSSFSGLKFILKFRLDNTMYAHHFHDSRALNDDFLLNALKTLFRLSRVLLDLQKCFVRGATKFVSCSVILGEVESYRNYKGFSSIFPKIQMHIEVLQN